MTEPKRVFVVDDLEEWRNHASEVVLECGHSVVTASSAREAMRLLDKESFDLLITDNFMEFEAAGLELLLHNWYLEKMIPSILHSSELSSEHAKTLREELPDVIYVKKSWNGTSPDLRAAIQKLLP